ncbi:MAG: hypothetical protein ACJAR2_001437 [Ilumatobacter sp.]
MGNLIVITASALDELDAETSWPLAFTVDISLSPTMHEGHARKQRELDNDIDAFHRDLKHPVH